MQYAVDHTRLPKATKCQMQASVNKSCSLENFTLGQLPEHAMNSDWHCICLDNKLNMATCTN